MSKEFKELEHSNSCSWPETSRCNCGASDHNSLVRGYYFYKSRCELLAKHQNTMRDPERTLVCDILANGQLLHGIENKRYKLENL